MPTNTLSYDGLKTVLQYLDVHLRYQLSSRIPSIRVTEKLVPVRFDHLFFDFLQTNVNDTTYRLFVYREYPDGYDIPKLHQEDNKNGGTHFDLTEHGFEIFRARVPVSPGDVEIRLQEEADPRFYNELVINTHQRLYERRIEFFEKALRTRLEHGEDAVLGEGDGDARTRVYRLGPTDNPRSIRDWLEIAEIEPNHRTRLVNGLMNIILPLSADKLREEIRNMQDRLVPYYCRRDNAQLPYIPMIQLTVESSSGKSIYRHPYTIKLQEALKKVNTALLGARNCVHRLKFFNVDKEPLIMRLPLGFRIRIRELRVELTNTANYTALESLVDKSSYPLNALTIKERVFEPETYEHEAVRSAKELNISPKFNPSPSCLPLILHRDNPSINVRRPFTWFSVREQVELMKNWIDNGKEVGTTLSYQTWRTRAVDLLLKKITRRFEGNRFDRRVTMPMKNGNKLKVQCSFLGKFEFPGRPFMREEDKWEVNMKVIAEQEKVDNGSSWCSVM